MGNVEEVNEVVDEMILCVFKIVIKGVRFLDVLEEERRLLVFIIVVIMVVEDNQVLLMLLVELFNFDVGYGLVVDVGFCVEDDGEIVERVQYVVSDVV